MHPTHSGLPLSSSLRSWLFRLSSLTMLGRQVPRAPLPATSVTWDRVASSTTSKSVTSPSSLVRAHAPNQLPPPDFVFPHLFPEVFAGCCEPLLKAASSRRYLCKSFPGCLSHDPVGLQGASACCFPYICGLPQVLPIGRLPRIFPRKETSCGRCFEIVAISYVQASWFARHPGLPYRCA
jgi:hypothetical protein